MVGSAQRTTLTWLSANISGLVKTRFVNYSVDPFNPTNTFSFASNYQLMAKIKVKQDDITTPVLHCYVIPFCFDFSIKT